MDRLAILAGSMSIPIDLVPKLKSLKRDLTLTYKPMGEEPRKLSLYRDSGDSILVPRQFGLEFCRRNDIPVEDRTSFGHTVDFPRTLEPRDYQVNTLLDLEEQTQEYFDFMFRARTGWGKCNIAGTPILMFDGTIKKVENIVVGDLLMGPDSTPRRVLSLAGGWEEMFAVTPNKGDTHVFNRSHILSLKATCNYGRWSKGEIVNVEIDEYLSWSAKQKHIFKLWRTGVDFSHKHQDFAPYFVGLYLGDGNKSGGVALTIGNTRPEVKEYLRLWGSQNNVAVAEYAEKGNCTRIKFNCGKGPMQDFFMLDLLYEGQRNIPHEYLTGSRDQRLQLLAGILDTDGYLYSSVFDLVCKDKHFADQIAYLCRSLGLAAYVSVCQKKAQGWESSRTYYRLKISGDTSMVPCRTPRRQAPLRKQVKDVLVTGFSIESRGIGQYYGFTLDGDRLYLLGDFTVTHNTAGALILASRLRRTTLIVVDQENLKDQWIEALVKHFGFKPSEIGSIQGTRCDYEGKAVCIAMLQTLSQKEYPPEVYDYFGFMIVDEVHTAGAPTFSVVLMDFSATTRIGVSATIKRPDGLQRALDYNLGRVRVYVHDQHAESSVYVIDSHTVYSFYANISPKVGRFVTEVSEDAGRNLLAAEAVVSLYDTGRDVLVLGDRIEQLQHLLDLCSYLGLPRGELGLYTGYMPVYRFAKDPSPARRPSGWERGTEYTPISLQLISKRIPKPRLKQVKETARVIFATYGMFSKGVDEPRLSAGVDVTPRARSEQVQGRILRVLKGKLEPIWATIRDRSSYRALYSMTGRIKDYQTNNARVYVCTDTDFQDKQEWPVDDLKNDLLMEVKRLKSMQIAPNSAGLNTLMTPMQALGLGLKAGRSTGKRKTQHQ